MLRGRSKLVARPKSAIVGIGGTSLTEEERALFQCHSPAGFILFKRNCQNPDQLRKLVDELHQAAPGHWPLVFIDQEGGRVARLGPPGWVHLPPAASLGELAERNRELGLEAARLHATLIAQDLCEVGIDSVCAPVLDVACRGMTDAIGDRAFCADAELVGEIGQAVIEVFRRYKIAPVIKHLPGHGRAILDSHVSLPRVSAELEQLKDCDFQPFRKCRDVPFAMTAHIVFDAIDGRHPATQSPTIIHDIVRGVIGFEGILLTDDISMGALSGGLVERAQRALDAGCDLVTHCTGIVDEVKTLLVSLPDVDERVEDGLLATTSQPNVTGAKPKRKKAELDHLLQRNSLNV